MFGSVVEYFFPPRPLLFLTSLPQPPLVLLLLLLLLSFTWSMCPHFVAPLCAPSSTNKPNRSISQINREGKQIGRMCVVKRANKGQFRNVGALGVEVKLNLKLVWGSGIFCFTQIFEPILGCFYQKLFVE